MEFVFLLAGGAEPSVLVDVCLSWILTIGRNGTGHPMGPQLEAELNARQSRQTVSDQAKAALKGLLAGHRPSIHDVARQLNLSSRTLQRRLTENGQLSAITRTSSPRIGASLLGAKLNRA